MILFYDTETTGFTQPRLPDDHPTQPHLVQLGCLLTEDDGTERAAIDVMVIPDGYTIPEQAARVHGLTTAIATMSGVPLLVAVAMFTNLRAQADLLVAHNLVFDEQVMRSAILRTGRTPRHPGPSRRVCTMTIAEPLTKLQMTDKMRAAGFKENKFKPPSLTECCRVLLGEELQGAHSAMVDVRACSRVYFEVMRRIAERSEELK